MNDESLFSEKVSKYKEYPTVDLCLRNLKEKYLFAASSYEVQLEILPEKYHYNLAWEITDETDFELNEGFIYVLWKEKKINSEVVKKMKNLSDSTIIISFGNPRFDTTLWELDAVKTNCFWEKYREDSKYILAALDSII